jgi:hypothetical protein
LNSGSATRTIDPNSSQRSAVVNRSGLRSIRTSMAGYGYETVNDAPVTEDLTEALGHTEGSILLFGYRVGI